MARNQTLILLTDNIAPSQIKRMAHISAWTYFTRREGLSLSATILAAIALLFLGLSRLLTSANNQVSEYLVKYTRNSDLQADNRVVFEATKTGVDVTDPSLAAIQQDIRWGSFIIKIDEKIPKPAYFQYVLENFYQNHMWYMRSVDGDQLRAGTGQSQKDMSNSYCRKLTYVSDNDNTVLFPCGLIPRSVFNDTFWLQISTDGSTWQPLAMDDDAKTISWEADYTKKCQNPKDYTPSLDYIVDPTIMHFWLVELFPPVRCEPVNFDSVNVWKPVYPSWRYVDGKKVVDCDGWHLPEKTCKFSFDRFSTNGTTCSALNAELQAQVGNTGTYLQERQVGENWGMQQGHFVNWVRTAGLPTFRKMYGKIDQDIPAGARIRVNFISRHFVPSVEKYVLIGNVSWYGGRNEFSATFALTSAIAAFVLSIILLCLAKTKKASMQGGIKVLQWK